MTNEQFPTTHGDFYLLANIGRPGCFVNSETMAKAKRLGLIDIAEDSHRYTCARLDVEYFSMLDEKCGIDEP